MANEKRLIDANALANEVAYSQHDNPHTNGRVRINHHNEHNHFLKMILDAPTVDAVEVVRCKDCKHRGENDDFICIGVEDDDFCSYGERREGDGQLETVSVLRWCSCYRQLRNDR